MSADSPDTETRQLLERIRDGDPHAAQRLFELYRSRLRRMVTVHFDRRLSARFDPSDVVQEALADAARRLPDYLRRQPVDFYPWLRQIAWEKLLRMRAEHVQRQKRSVGREESLHLSDESYAQLVDRFASSGTSPSQRLVRAEVRDRVRSALKRLSDADRQVFVLRFLEQLSMREAAAVAGVKEQAFMKRQVRAVQRLRVLLDQDGESL